MFLNTLNYCCQLKSLGNFWEETVLSLLRWDRCAEIMVLRLLCRDECDKNCCANIVVLGLLTYTKDSRYKYLSKYLSCSIIKSFCCHCKWIQCSTINYWQFLQRKSVFLVTFSGTFSHPRWNHPKHFSHWIMKTLFMCGCLQWQKSSISSLLV